MGECSALATKQELENLRKQFINLDQEVDGKVNESDKPYIIQTAAGIGSTAALALLDPKVRQTLAKVASLSSQIGDLFAKYANVLSIISTLASVTALTILQYRVAKLEGKTEVLEVLVEALEIENNELRKGLNKSNEKLNKTIETSNLAIKKANNAVAVANTAIQRSEIAVAQSNQAIIDANQATTKADQAIAKANSNSQKAEQAIAAAELATNKANQVIDTTNNNAQLVTSLRLENAALKEKTDSLTLELATQKTALESANQKIEDYKTGVEPVVKEYVTRKVREAQVTTYGDITGLKSSARELESSFDVRTREVVKDVRDLEKRIDQIQTGVFHPGTSSDFDRQGAYGGGGLNSSQVKDIVDTQIDSRLKEVTSVNDKQYQNVLDQLKDIPVVTGAVVTGALAPTLKPIADNVSRTVSQTTAPAITQAATQGVCNSTRPGGCMQRNVVDKLTGNVGDLINAGGTAISAANNALLLKMNGTLNNIKGTVTTIKNVTNTTLGVVQHAKYGLKAVQKAADVAWKATHNDKALQMLNTALLINNAMFLGSNIADTVGDVASLVLGTLGVKDSEGQAINVNQVIGNTVKNWIVGVVGQANYAAYEAKIKSRIRTYQAAANLYSSVRSMLASAEDIAEETGINVAQIGNALRDSNAVETDSYGYMPEGNRRTNKIFKALEKGDELADSLYTITTDAVDLYQESNEFNNERKVFQDLLEAERKLEVRKSERAANRIESLPNIQESDKLESEDEPE